MRVNNFVRSLEVMLVTQPRTDDINALFGFLEDYKKNKEKIGYDDFLDFSQKVGLKLPEMLKKPYQRLIGRLNDDLKGIGYRESHLILTAQEYATKGTNFIEPFILAKPHVPIGILRKQISIEDARKARAIKRKTQAFGFYFFEDRLNSVPISLEQIDERGITIRDPRVLSENYAPVETTYQDDFKFRRDV
jgi:hypothetical protein